MLDSPSPDDVEAIVGLIERAGVFGPMDVACVRELLDEYFGKGDHGGYEFLVFRRDGRVLGMACYGPTPLTEGTFDLYWLAVAPEARREGVGRALLDRAEADVRRRGARMLVVETSGTPSYEPARRFYLARGYHRQATIPDFYAPADDLVIYVKRFDIPGP